LFKKKLQFKIKLLKIIKKYKIKKSTSQKGNTNLLHLKI
jgi:hypothetical protein